jgi:predicted Ser/Thr protein kinase
VSAPAPLDPERWRKVNDIFHRALDRPPGERPVFVATEAAGDAALAAEVLSLLSAHSRADSFMEQPAASAADHAALTVAAETLPAGTMVGQYRIDRVLGQGGMGVVYLAEDLRLGRTVALKAVAPRFTGDAARRERLRREARAAAALSDPGIATVYALEEIDGHMFIAGEFVPGETLREEIAHGPLGLERTVETALAIARALTVAHDRGVVHRDLKPENVVRTPGGVIKILDFGLARMRDAASQVTLTRDGTVVGTPAYMSPEQIRGESADPRSDLFALGIMIYELLSGERPFAGVDAASTIARILESEPGRLTDRFAAGSTNLAILGALDQIVRTCLRKSATARYQSAHDLVHALDLVRQGRISGLGAYAPGPVALMPASALWWWQFHQASASVGYLLLLVPLWLARQWIGDRIGLILFLAGLSAALAAAILRSHLWFTVRSYPGEWARQHAHTGVWLKAADILFVVALLAAGAGVLDKHASGAAILIGAAVAVLLSSMIIEPATTRAALGDDH